MSNTKLDLNLSEVEKAMRELSSVHKPEKWLARNYVGGGLSQRDFLDVKIPHVRKRFTQGFSFSQNSPHDQWVIWNYIWLRSNTFETMLLSSYWVSQRPLQELISYAPMIFRWANRVDNWAHSDEMSGHYSKILESNHKQFFPTFEKWSRSKNPWLRRQSLVGLLFYSRMRKKTLPFSTLKKSIDRQMNDKHFYVQKGVGWALRECWNVYPQETEMYLQLNAHRVPPAGWTAATEKLSPKTKAKLTSLRKALRAQKK